MQWASAMVIVAFAASMWIAGQRFIQHRASKHPAHVSILNSVLPCGDRAFVSDDRIEIAHMRVRSCGRL
jgi:hypothetical protein